MSPEVGSESSNITNNHRNKEYIRCLPLISTEKKERKSGKKEGGRKGCGEKRAQ